MPSQIDDWRRCIRPKPLAVGCSGSDVGNSLVAVYRAVRLRKVSAADG